MVNSDLVPIEYDDEMEEDFREVLSWKDKPDGADGYLKWIHDSTPYVGCDLIALQILCNQVYLSKVPDLLPNVHVRPFVDPIRVCE